MHGTHTLVKLKRLQIRLNRHRHGLFGQRLHQRVGRIHYIDKGLHTGVFHTLTQPLFTRTTAKPALVPGIGIVHFGTNTGRVFVKQKGIVHQTATAAEIKFITVNQLLLRQRDEITRIKKVFAFNGSNGRKGPARTAHALILDWNDGTFFDPVNFVRNVLETTTLSCDLRLRLRRRRLALMLNPRTVLAEFVDFVELILSQIRELVVTNGKRDMLLGIMGLNKDLEETIDMKQCEPNEDAFLVSLSA